VSSSKAKHTKKKTQDSLKDYKLSTMATSKNESVQVYVRVRPLVERELTLVVEQDDDGEPSAIESTITVVENSLSVRSPNLSHSVKCTFDKVLPPESTQETMYGCVRDSVMSVLDGFNTTLFAYGQTGSGKTHTMFGQGQGEEKFNFKRGVPLAAGIIPRAIRDIFVTLQEQSKKKSPGENFTFEVYCSFTQIYNESIYDLLHDQSRMTALAIHEDRKDGVYVEGLSEYAVTSVQDCLNILKMGENHRAIRSTHMNQGSSRSHSIFTLLVEQHTSEGSGKSASNKVTTKSKLNLVDLAGSEKWDLSQNLEGGHIEEMTNINLSLHTLGRCIASLAKISRARATSGSSSVVGHVPYRDSKLTRLLQDSLGGNCKTRVIATLSPSPDCAEETVSTLKFADRAKQIMQFAKVNEEMEVDHKLVEKLRREIEQLKALLQQCQDNPVTTGAGSGSGGAEETGGEGRLSPEFKSYLLGLYNKLVSVGEVPPTPPHGLSGLFNCKIHAEMRAKGSGGGGGTGGGGDAQDGGSGLSLPRVNSALSLPPSEPPSSSSIGAPPRNNIGVVKSQPPPEDVDASRWPPQLSSQSDPPDAELVREIQLLKEQNEAMKFYMNGLKQVGTKFFAYQIEEDELKAEFEKTFSGLRQHLRTAPGKSQRFITPSSSTASPLSSTHAEAEVRQSISAHSHLKSRSKKVPPPSINNRTNLPLSVSFTPPPPPSLSLPPPQLTTPFPLYLQPHRFIQADYCINMSIEL
jgi:kinesin family protein 3/17